MCKPGGARIGPESLHTCADETVICCSHRTVNTSEHKDHFMGICKYFTCGRQAAVACCRHVWAVNVGITSVKKSPIPFVIWASKNCGLWPHRYHVTSKRNKAHLFFFRRLIPGLLIGGNFIFCLVYGILNLTRDRGDSRTATKSSVSPDNIPLEAVSSKR